MHHGRLGREGLCKGELFCFSPWRRLTLCIREELNKVQRGHTCETSNHVSLSKPAGADRFGLAADLKPCTCVYALVRAGACVRVAGWPIKIMQSFHAVQQTLRGRLRILGQAHKIDRVTWAQGSQVAMGKA